MSADKHTPGPWTINGKTHSGWRIDSLGVEREGADFINNPVGFATTVEDGRLMIAAPEMLEALRCIVSDSSGLLSAVDDEGHELTQPLRADLERARAAISKATGEK
jgi:hypothetical protein